jgi:hypothetical protein
LNDDIEREIATGFDLLSPRYHRQIQEDFIENILQSTNNEIKRLWIRNITAGRLCPYITPEPTPRPAAQILDTTQRLVTQFFQRV